VTDIQKKGDDEEIWTLHDMTIPTMNTAKLIRVKDPFNPDFRI
jgi:hypothetical protein